MPRKLLSGVSDPRHFEYVVGQLREVYTPEGVEIWLHGCNRGLGGSKPIDLLTDGDFQPVVDAIERLKTGAM